jgi:hypothetical protein
LAGVELVLLDYPEAHGLSYLLCTRVMCVGINSCDVKMATHLYALMRLIMYLHCCSTAVFT